MATMDRDLDALERAWAATEEAAEGEEAAEAPADVFSP